MTFSRRPGERFNRGRIATQGGSSVPALFTAAQGMVLWLDSDYSGGVADGSTSPAPINRVTGSGAGIALVAGGGSLTYRATGWNGQRVQSCWHHINKNLRVTDSTVVNTAVGVGKTWTKISVTMPRWTGASTALGSTQYGSGWDQFAAGAFTVSCGMTLITNSRYTWAAKSNVAAEVVDTALVNQCAQIVGFMRDTATTCKFGINNVWGSSVTYGSGTNYVLDGYSVGGYAFGSAGNGQGDIYTRAEMVWNRALTVAELNEVHAYLTQIYSGFENVASLGATSTPETLVFLSIGQSNEVGDPPDGVTDTFTDLTDVWVVGINGITRPLTTPTYAGTLNAKGPINHLSPDVPGQSSLESTARRLRELGVTSRIIFVTAALGSTGATTWNNGHATSPKNYQTVYGAAVKDLSEAMRAPGAILAGVLFNQGEFEAQLGAVEAAAWTTNWDTTCTDLLAFATAQSWIWKKTNKRFFLAKLQNGSTLTFKDNVRAAQDLLVGTTRTDVSMVQEPDASPANLHLYSAQQIALGVLRADDWFAAT